MLSTLCPDCATRFRIRSEQLRSAGGWVRCGECGAVFDALKSLRESDPTARGPLQPQGNGGQIESPFLVARKTKPKTPPKPGPGGPLPPHRLDQIDRPPEDETPETDPGFDLASQDPQDQIPEQRELEQTQAAGAARPMPFEIPPGLPDIQPLAADDADTGTSLSARLAWGLGSLGLVLLMGLQLVWFERDQLIYYPTGHTLLQGMCDLAGCSLPPRRDLKQLQILSRDIRSETGNPRHLALRLVFANLASHPQPYPQIQLSLFSESGELVAQRTFSPEEYLATPPRGLLPPQEQVRVSLELREPAKAVNGFRFEFL